LASFEIEPRLFWCVLAHYLYRLNKTRGSSKQQHQFNRHYLQDNTDMYLLWFGQACVNLVNLGIAIYLYHNAAKKAKSCAVVTAVMFLVLETVLNSFFLVGTSSSIVTAWSTLVPASAAAVAMVKAHYHDHRNLTHHDDFDADMVIPLGSYRSLNI